ncbi:ATP-binding protein, partial [Streptomyces sparsus]
VSVAVRSEPGGALLVRVADSGDGVDGTQLGSMFSSGWSSSRPEGAHGRGLGLSLVQQVINRYDGEVDVAGGEVDVAGGAGGDAGGAGAVFTVRLRPLRQEPEG